MEILVLLFEDPISNDKEKKYRHFPPGTPLAKNICLNYFD